MNQFFLYWADIVALLLSLALGLILTIKAIKKSFFCMRPVAVFFLFFGPSAIVVHMSFHITEIFYRAAVAVVEGTFNYSFRFYSLQLMGAVLTCLSVEFLRKAFARCSRRYFKNKDIFKTMGFIVLVSIPTVPFTPIGSLPTLACLISLVALPFVHKKKDRKRIVPSKAPSIVLGEAI